jgi:hypothetical protein
MGDFEMMKKTTSALAVAALLGTGAASAATFQVNDDTTISISGGIYYAYVSQTDANGNDQTTFGDNGSDVIFSGEHAAANGITTFFNLDTDGYDATEANSSSQGEVVDEASVGVRGSFGEVVIGSNAGVYDQYADFADGGPIGWTNRTTFSNGDVSDVIQYSNSVANLSFTLQAQVGDQGSESVSETDSSGDTLGDTTVTDAAAGTSNTSLGLGATADLGAVSLSAAYEERANQTADEPIYGLGASTTVADIALTVGYEVDDNNANSIDKISLDGAYSVGPATFTAGVQNVSFDENPTGAQDTVTDTDQTDDSFTEFQVGVSYAINSQMSVAAEMVTTDRENDENDFAALGVNYSW